VVVVLLYVGLVRLVLLPVWVQLVSPSDGLQYQVGELLGQPSAMGPTLLHVLLGINILLLLYLWVNYRARMRVGNPGATTAIAFGGAGLLLLYLSWVLSRLAVWIPVYVHEVG